MVKKLIIMRGIPGSGKSTRALELCEEARAQNLLPIICSTDKFFEDDNGVYKFDPSKLRVNHQKNQSFAHMAMKEGYDVVIIDNTNIKRRDFKTYSDSAKLFNYEVEEIVIGKFDEESAKIYHGRNKHNVPLEAILRMAREFQS